MAISSSRSWLTATFCLRRAAVTAAAAVFSAATTSSAIAATAGRSVPTALLHGDFGVIAMRGAAGFSAAA